MFDQIGKCAIKSGKKHENAIALTEVATYQLTGYHGYPAHTKKNSFSRLLANDERLRWKDHIFAGPQLFYKPKIRNRNPIKSLYNKENKQTQPNTTNSQIY